MLARHPRSRATRAACPPLRLLVASLLCATGAANAATVGGANAATASSGSSYVNVGHVSANSEALNTLEGTPTKKQIFKSTQSIKVIGKKQMSLAGPASGAAQALSVAPGVNVATEGVSGAPRSSISINGMKTGWGNIAGNANDGTVMVTFDGVPMVDPAYTVWQASEIPQLSLIQAMSVTYGPGYAMNRWYNNIGGSINFAPLQPARRASATLGTFAGSFSTYGGYFNVQTGKMGDGWSGVVAGGVTRADGNYLHGYGFNNPSKNHAYYAKFRKTFHGGHVSFGTAQVRVGDRPLVLSPRHFSVLHELTRSPGRLLTTERLCSGINGIRPMTPAALAVCVSRLRKLLRDAGAPDCIETVHCLGYRYTLSAADDTGSGHGAPWIDPLTCL